MATNNENLKHVVILFDTGARKDYMVVKDFNSQKHMDNYLAMMKRDHGWVPDEIYFDKEQKRVATQ